ncbi:E3 ubiquitin-protein ligase TRIM45-like [Sycon ciliatum]|uniref:E3 ubiquitin-protein ligase TRIM45-like n=1 Tax=Sycon ciliatum TaxID=27933 RepID=UPI0031F7141C
MAAVQVSSAAYNCVFCQKTAVAAAAAAAGQSVPPGKLLSCFHIICRECLDNEINADAVVKCKACGEATKLPRQTASLLPSAGVIVKAEHRGINGAGISSAVAEMLCDDCDVSEEQDAAAATHECVNCSLLLCQTCAQAHTRRRSSRHHTVASLQERADTSAQQTEHTLHVCPLHRKHPLSLYCESCKDACCQRCYDTGAHTTDGSRHALVRVEEKASAIRDSIRAENERGDTNRMTMTKAIAEVSSTIEDITTQTEKASEDVHAFFEMAINTLRERENALRAQLDRLCWEKLKHLELQRSKLDELESGAELRDTAKEHFIGRPSNSNELLLVSDWIKHLDWKANNVLQSSAEPCSMTCFYFTPTDNDAFRKVVRTLGEVEDGMIDVDSSKLTITRTMTEDHMLIIGVKIIAHCRGVKDVASMASKYIKVQIQSPNDQVAECQPTDVTNTAAAAAASAHADVHLSYRYEVQAPGDYLVPVTLAKTGRHFPGSPSRVQVAAMVNTFDPEASSKNIAFSHSFRTAQKKVARNYDYAIGLSMMSTGTHHYKLQCSGLVEHPNNNLHIGVTSSTTQTNENVFPKDHFSGFISDPKFMFGSGNIERTFTTRWQDDVISLVMDCEKHVLSLRNERTGETGIIRNVCNGKLPVRFAAALYLKEHIVTLL